MATSRVLCSDYDDRTPLHLAACNGNTAVLEYLLKQETVLVNAVDRFGGTPYMDAIRFVCFVCVCVRERERERKRVYVYICVYLYIDICIFNIYIHIYICIYMMYKYK